MKTCFSHLNSAKSERGERFSRKIADFVYNSAGVGLHSHSHNIKTSFNQTAARSQYDDDKMNGWKKIKLFFYTLSRRDFFVFFAIIIATLNHANDTSLHAPSLTRFLLCNCFRTKINAQLLFSFYILNDDF
jgi:hypothetical protein